VSKDEYDVLIWVLGNFANEFNQAAILVVSASATVSLLNYSASRIQKYFRHRLDVEFWTDTLSI